MKNIFKLLGIALLASSMLIACNKDNEGDNNGNNNTDTTPVNPQPQPNPDQQGTVAINWGGEAATIGIVDAYKLQANSTVFILNAAQGLENDNYQFPMFRLGLDLDTDPQYGCALTAQYQYGGNPGNTFFPTDVVESTYFSTQNSYNMGIVGDWWLDMYTVEQPNFQLTNAEFDATTLRLTTSFSVQMFNYVTVNANITENTTEQEIMALIQQAEKKQMAVTLTNYKFEDAQATK